MLVIGLPADEKNRTGNPFYLHFPALKTHLPTISGPRGAPLRRLGEDPKLFQHWDIGMRYAPPEEIDRRWVDRWKNSAEELVGRMASL